MKSIYAIKCMSTQGHKLLHSTERYKYKWKVRITSLTTLFLLSYWGGGESEKKGLADVISVHDIHDSTDQSDLTLTRSNM